MTQHCPALNYLKYSAQVVPAPEANHAVRRAIDEALKCKQEGVGRTILLNLSGHGNFDMQAYADYFAGKLEDRELDQGGTRSPVCGIAARGCVKTVCPMTGDGLGFGATKASAASA